MGSGWPPCAPINPPTCLTEIKRCTCVYADDGEQHSLGDVTRPSVDSAFSLPPSRSQPPCADQPLPVPARLRDDDRSTKPRIWSLAEVATSSDHRPKRSDRDAASSTDRRRAASPEPEVVGRRKAAGNETAEVKRRNRPTV